jgi:hypothetical protein
MYKKILIPALFLICLSYPAHLFSQNKKVNGYRGIWFNEDSVQGSGYKFSGGVATFATRHRPVSIYSPEAGKTFFVYGGTTTAEERHLLIMVSYFDHKLHRVPKPVIVYDKMGVREPHDNASLSIDAGGYLWVFVSGRGRTRPGLIFKSTMPYSIDDFEKVMEWEMTSPQPWSMEDNGFLLLFSKTTEGRELYWSLSPDGKSWPETRKLAGMGGHFQVSGKYGKKLVTVFDYHPGGDVDRRTNLYLLQTDDQGMNWKTIDNNTVETPVTDIRSEALIRDFKAEGKLVHITDLNFDTGGNPVILVVLSDESGSGSGSGPKEWVVIHRKDQKWEFNRVCTSDHFYDKGFLEIEEDEWRIIGTTGPGPQKNGTGGEIALWVSKNEGRDWVKVRDVTANSRYNNSFVRGIVNATKDFYAVWADGDANKFSISHLYFTNEKCNRVWVLPYEMKKDLEKPVRIR